MVARRALPPLLLAALLISLCSAQNLSVTDLLSPAGKPFDSNGDNFDILTRLLSLANLTSTAAQLSNFTLFAPNDRAFVRTARYIANFTGPIGAEAAAFDAAVAAVTAGVRVGNATLSGPPLLREVLLYHVVASPVTSAMLVARPSLVATLAGAGRSTLINVGNGELVDQSPDTPNPSIVAGNFDIRVANGGVVHVVNAVLLPVPVEVALQKLFTCNATA